MAGRFPEARRRRRAAACVAAAVLGGGASAQSVDEAIKPLGFPAGPVVIAPSLTAGYSYDSNVFLRPEPTGCPADDPNCTPAQPVSPDHVLTLQPAFQLTVPFSNSSFRFGDVLTYVDYSTTPQTAGKTSNDAVAELILNFGSLDRLELSAHNIAGVAEALAFDPGGESTFQGNAYRLHTVGASVSREVAGARGYRFSLDRNALKFDPSVEVAFFDYSGFDGEGAYLQPLSPNTRLAFGYLGTRYDHYDTTPGSDPNVVYRTESGDAAYAQIEGRLGPKQPYSVRLGWERLAFTGNAAKDYSGIIGDGRLSAIVGGGTTFTVVAKRQPYRSFFGENNFYVYDQVGGQVDRTFPRGSGVGGNVAFSRNTYDEPVDGIIRVDRTMRLEAYANLALRDRIVFRISVVENLRHSNYPSADYSETIVFGGFVFGWI